MSRSPSAASDANALLQEALLRLLNNEMLTPFREWFSARMLAALQAERPFATSELDEARRYQQHIARQLWGHMPVPSNRWRARGLPKVERNGPCHCGSGHKYKQCCSAFEHEPLPIPTDALMVMALGAAEPEMLTPEKLRQIPAQALGEAAMNWNDEGLAGKTLAVLGPVFEDGKALDERYEVALDALVDAMQRLGQDRLRQLLLEQMSRHTNKVLATAARCRLVSVLADQGEDEKAWKLFHETSRFNPNDPQLWPLELTLLLSQGRREEAMLRVPLLMARARQAGLDDLADALSRMAKEGMEAAYASLDNASQDDPVWQAWLDLASATPDAPDTEALLSLYKVDRFESEEKGKSVLVAAFKPAKKLADLNARWRRRFLVGKPEMTSLHADVETLLDSLPEALAFLDKDPSAWLSAEVLDDLLLAAIELCEEDAPSSVVAAARRVADHALAVMHALAGDAQLHWIDPNTRPLLRCLAVAVELARMTRDTVRAMDLLRMGLALNPNDNHGWRAQLAPLLIEDRQYPAALALFAQYPDDMPPSEHLHALALFGIDKKDEAEAMLREAHKDFPLFLNFLLPDTMDAPPEEPGPGMRIGGATAAWYHRIEWRAMWVRSGALAWAKTLKLPEPTQRKPAKSRKPATPTPTPERPAAAGMVLGIKKHTQPFGKTQEKRLQKTCSDYPRLHGLLLAVAWSPQMLMPNTWLPLAMDLHDRMPKSRTEATANKALSDALDATVQLYNHVNQGVLDNQGEIQPPLLVMLSAVTPTDEAAYSLAAGFISGCETAIPAWARLGHKVTGFTGPFGRLRALAARAPTKDGQSLVQQDNGSPLLQPVENSTPAPIELTMALAELWPAVVAERLKMR